jgi:hypothetical protein
MPPLGNYLPLREFLLWVGHDPTRAVAWGHTFRARQVVRRDFEKARQGRLAPEDWELIKRGDFAVLRNICSDSNKVACFLVLMTSVAKPRGK